MGFSAFMSMLQNQSTYASTSAGAGLLVCCVVLCCSTFCLLREGCFLCHFLASMWLLSECDSSLFPRTYVSLDSVIHFAHVFCCFYRFLMVRRRNIAFRVVLIGRICVFSSRPWNCLLRCASLKALLSALDVPGLSVPRPCCPAGLFSCRPDVLYVLTIAPWALSRVLLLC